MRRGREGETYLNNADWFSGQMVGHVTYECEDNDEYFVPAKHMQIYR